MMKNKISIGYLLVASACLGVISGCAPIKTYHGKNVTDDEIKDIKVGKSRKVDVMRAIGTPTITDTEMGNRWVYVYKKTSRKAFFDEKLDLFNGVEFIFDKNDKLIKIKKYTKNDFRKIDMDPEITKVDHKEENIIGQLLGNFGQMGSGKSKGSDL